MSFKLEQEVGIALVLNSLMDDDFGVTLNCFCLLLTLRSPRMCGVFDYFHPFLRKYEKRKTRNMLSSMLDS
jgi:hypothetical protein